MDHVELFSRKSDAAITGCRAVELAVFVSVWLGLLIADLLL